MRSFLLIVYTYHQSLPTSSVDVGTDVVEALCRSTGRDLRVTKRSAKRMNVEGGRRGIRRRVDIEMLV